jgi:hypothetical protein
MDFIDEIKQFSVKVSEIKSKIQTEEATKVSLVMPFLQLLGYNVFDPHEVIPEFTADVGTKKGEKVDYAILIDGKPSILIEAKPVDDLLKTHDSQLYRYFSVTESKFAVLTNGIIYKFYSDIQEPNKMDDTPFLEFNLLDIKEPLVSELKRFKKESYNTEELSTAATTLKYTNKIKSLFDDELKEPKEDFIKYFIREIYSGKATQNVIDKFKPIIKKALNQYISDLMNEKIKAALEASETVESEAAPVVEEQGDGKREIVTTALELEAFFVVKSICREVIETKRITYKDTLSYFSILFDNSTWKWICRLYLEGNKKYIGIIKDEKEVKIQINGIDDIFNFSNDIKETVKKYLGNA